MSSDPTATANTPENTAPDTAATGDANVAASEESLDEADGEQECPCEEDKLYIFPFRYAMDVVQDIEKDYETLCLHPIVESERLKPDLPSLQTRTYTLRQLRNGYLYALHMKEEAEDGELEEFTVEGITISQNGTPYLEYEKNGTLYLAYSSLQWTERLKKHAKERVTGKSEDTTDAGSGEAGATSSIVEDASTTPITEPKTFIHKFRAINLQCPTISQPHTEELEEGLQFVADLEKEGENQAPAEGTQGFAQDDSQATSPTPASDPFYFTCIPTSEDNNLQTQRQEECPEIAPAFAMKPIVSAAEIKSSVPEGYENCALLVALRDDFAVVEDMTLLAEGRMLEYTEWYGSNELGLYMTEEIVKAAEKPLNNWVDDDILANLSLDQELLLWEESQELQALYEDWQKKRNQDLENPDITDSDTSFPTSPESEAAWEALQQKREELRKKGIEVKNTPSTLNSAGRLSQLYIDYPGILAYRNAKYQQHLALYRHKKEAYLDVCTLYDAIQLDLEFEGFDRAEEVIYHYTAPLISRLAILLSETEESLTWFKTEMEQTRTMVGGLPYAYSRDIAQILKSNKRFSDTAIATRDLVSVSLSQKDLQFLLNSASSAISRKANQALTEALDIVHRPIVQAVDDLLGAMRQAHSNDPLAIADEIIQIVLQYDKYGTVVTRNPKNKGNFNNFYNTLVGLLEDRQRLEAQHKKPLGNTRTSRRANQAKTARQLAENQRAIDAHIQNHRVNVVEVSEGAPAKQQAGILHRARVNAADKMVKLNQRTAALQARAKEFGQAVAGRGGLLNHVVILAEALNTAYLTVELMKMPNEQRGEAVARSLVQLASIYALTYSAGLDYLKKSAQGGNAKSLAALHKRLAFKSTAVTEKVIDKASKIITRRLILGHGLGAMVYRYDANRAAERAEQALLPYESQVWNIISNMNGAMIGASIGIIIGTVFPVLGVVAIGSRIALGLLTFRTILMELYAETLAATVIQQWLYGTPWGRGNQHAVTSHSQLEYTLDQMEKPSSAPPSSTIAGLGTNRSFPDWKPEPYDIWDCLRHLDKINMQPAVYIQDITSALTRLGVPREADTYVYCLQVSLPMALDGHLVSVECEANATMEIIMEGTTFAESLGICEGSASFGKAPTEIYTSANAADTHMVLPIYFKHRPQGLTFRTPNSFKLTITYDQEKELPNPLAVTQHPIYTYTIEATTDKTARPSFKPPQLSFNVRGNFNVACSVSAWGL